MKIIIVGAGISGLTAARQFKLRKIETEILEAKNRIGGRVHTISLNGTPVDMGASWLHDYQFNPLYKGVLNSDKVKYEMIETFYNKHQGYNSNNTPYSSSDLLKIEQFEAHIDRIIRLSSDLTQDVSLSSRLFSTYFNKLSLQDKILYKQVVNDLVEQEYVVSTDELSAKWFDWGFWKYSGDMLLKKGQSEIINLLSRNLQITTNCIVQGIDYTGAQVKVSTNLGEKTADKVLVTVPVGVLKNNLITFTPTLPSKKIEAIQKINMGSYSKLYLEFSSLFWPADKDWITQSRSLEEFGKWTEWFSLYRSTGAKILLGFNAGNFSKILDETYTDQQIVDEGMNKLRLLFGQNIPNPISTAISRWYTDPYSKGAYSSLGIGATPNSRIDLLDPVNDKLYFSGEATSPQHASTMKGAYLSGRAAATYMLNNTRPSYIQL